MVKSKTPAATPPPTKSMGQDLFDFFNENYDVAYRAEGLADFLKLLQNNRLWDLPRKTVWAKKDLQEFSRIIIISTNLLHIAANKGVRNFPSSGKFLELDVMLKIEAAPEPGAAEITQPTPRRAPPRPVPAPRDASPIRQPSPGAQKFNEDQLELNRNQLTEEQTAERNHEQTIENAESRLPTLQQAFENLEQTYNEKQDAFTTLGQQKFMEYRNNLSAMGSDAEFKQAEQEQETAKKNFEAKKKEHNKWEQRKNKAEQKIISVKSRIRHLKNEIRKLERGPPVPTMPEDDTQLEIDFSREPYPKQNAEAERLFGIDERYYSFYQELDPNYQINGRHPKKAAALTRFFQLLPQQDFFKDIAVDDDGGKITPASSSDEDEDEDDDEDGWMEDAQPPAPAPAPKRGPGRPRKEDTPASKKSRKKD